MSDQADPLKAPSTASLTPRKSKILLPQPPRSLNQNLEPLVCCNQILCFTLEESLTSRKVHLRITQHVPNSLPRTGTMCLGDSMSARSARSRTVDGMTLILWSNMSFVYRRQTSTRAPGGTLSTAMTMTGQAMRCRER